MPAPSRSPKPETIIRWVNGNLQVNDYIIPWQQCTVNLDATYEFDDETDPNRVVEHCLMFQFNNPNLVPGFIPDKDDPEDWTWVLDGELAEAVRQFLASSSG